MAVRLAPVAQMLVMAAIVTTALLVPVGALLAIVAVAVFRLPFASLLTFGGALSVPVGVLAWWGILLVPVLVYSAAVMPWHPRDSWDS
jgi:hypothetical protein